MSTYLIIGNLFSLLSAICIAVSVIKKEKKTAILWQLWNIVFSIFACIALQAYAALVVCTIVLIRNYLACKDKLNDRITFVLVVLCIIVGLIINNLGIIGLLAIVASSSYTFFMYISKDEQQLRWALLSNLILWLIHDSYIQAYPASITCAVLIVWTSIQIIINKSKKMN